MERPQGNALTLSTGMWGGGRQGLCRPRWSGLRALHSFWGQVHRLAGVEVSVRPRGVAQGECTHIGYRPACGMANDGVSARPGGAALWHCWEVWHSLWEEVRRLVGIEFLCTHMDQPQGNAFTLGTGMWAAGCGSLCTPSWNGLSPEWTRI